MFDRSDGAGDKELQDKSFEVMLDGRENRVLQDGVGDCNQVWRHTADVSTVVASKQRSWHQRQGTSERNSMIEGEEG